MTAACSTDAVSVLAQLASEDPYTAVDSSIGSDDTQSLADTGASATTAAEQKPGLVTHLQSSAATQSPVSALQMLQQLLASSPCSSRSQELQTESCSSAFGPAHWSYTDTAAVEPASDQHIIGDFCSRTVPKRWLRQVMLGWHHVIKSKIKWRCIEQASALTYWPASKLLSLHNT